MHYHRITMYCDYGADDAVATLHILRNSKFACMDIVPIGGNVSAEVAFNNAQKLLNAVNADASRVRIIDTRGITQPYANIPDVHGGDGMGDLLQPCTSKLTVVDIADYINELKAMSTLEASDAPPKSGGDVIISLGPCLIPLFVNKASGYNAPTVLMGGTVSEPPNYGGYEFNEALDVNGFKALAHSAAAVATLDTCHNPKFGFDDYKTGDSICDGIIASYRGLSRARGDKVFAVYDLCAALYVTNPELFELNRVSRVDGVEFNQLEFLGF